MKKITLLLLIASFLLLITPVLAEGEEPSYVTKWTPITEILEDRVTFEHPKFAYVDYKGNNIYPESYTLKIEMDGVTIEEGPYNPDKPDNIIEVEYDNSAAHKIRFTLWAHYPDGNPFVKHQLGLINIETEKAFDWNWEYDAPTCEGLKITWPIDLPHDAIDVNIRIKDLITGEVITKNFRDADGFELGIEHVFEIELEYFEYEWVQVHGTNYHWEGSVVCGVKPEIPEEPTPEPETPEPEEPETPEEEIPEEEIPDTDTPEDQTPEPEDQTPKDEVPESEETTTEVPELKTPEAPEVPEVPVPETSIPETPETPVPTLPVTGSTGSAVNWIGYLFMAIGLVMIRLKK